MYQSRKLTILFAIASLMVSATLLGGCRVGSGIDATFTPLPPTPVPTFSPLAAPDEVVRRFADTYSKPVDDSMKDIYALFDGPYAQVGAGPIICALQSSRSSYGSFSSYTIVSTTISGTVALVRASMVAPINTIKVSFNLTNEAGKGWRIDSIIGWIGGDITPQHPVGASLSCLRPALATRLASSAKGADGAEAKGDAGRIEMRPASLYQVAEERVYFL